MVMFSRRENLLKRLEGMSAAVLCPFVFHTFVRGAQVQTSC